MTETEVIIVGAGPTGLMAATLLRRCGVQVRIFDKAERAAQESRAFGFQAKSMELMLKIGLDQEFLMRGLTIASGQFFVDGKQAAEIAFDNIGRDDTPFACLFFLPQSETEAILGEDLRRLGVMVERPVEVTGFTQSDAGVTVQARARSGAEFEVRASYLIGADGAHSIVRKTLGLTFEGAPYPSTFMLADCHLKWPLDYSHLRLFMRGLHFAIFLPLRGKEYGRIIALKAEPERELSAAAAEATTSEPLTLEEIQEATREATGLDVTLENPVWMTRYRIHHRGVNSYRRGHVFVAGDAAHIHSPAGGQGMNTGLQDAANLAWKLALALRGGGGERLLDTYHSERWPVGQRVLQYTDRLFSFMSSQTGWVASLRNALVPLITGTMSKSGRLRSKAFHFLSQLGIRYEGDCLEDVIVGDVPSAWREGLTPGHRAPNGLAARHLDIFDLTEGYGFHVLAFSRRALSEAEIEATSEALQALPSPAGFRLASVLVANSLVGRDRRIIRAESSQAFEMYGIINEVPQALFLIRPDGYIAFRSNRLETGPLAEFLRAWS